MPVISVQLLVICVINMMVSVYAETILMAVCVTGTSITLLIVVNHCKL